MNDLDAAFGLSAGQRFERLLTGLKETAGVWSLADGEGDEAGLAVSETAEGVSCFSIWPDEALAQACALGDWAENRPMWIPLAELQGEWLPQLGAMGVIVSVFPTPEGEGVEMAADALLKELEQ